MGSHERKAWFVIPKSYCGRVYPTCWQGEAVHGGYTLLLFFGVCFPVHYSFPLILGYWAGVTAMYFAILRITGEKRPLPEPQQECVLPGDRGFWFAKDGLVAPCSRQGWIVVAGFFVFLFGAMFLFDPKSEPLFLCGYVAVLTGTISVILAFKREKPA